MKIGELAKRAGTNHETIRFYEKAGLLPLPPRTSGNYRDYDHRHGRRLSFIRQARGLGFDLPSIRALLELSDQPPLACAEADRIASDHLRTVRAKIAQLRSLQSELRRMIEKCRGGQVGDCRLIEVLSNLAECHTHPV